MKIVNTQYTSSTKSLDIYVSGCKPPHCNGCHNSEIFSFDIGKLCDLSCCNSIVYKIQEFNKLVKNIMIYGGEPLDQDINSLLLMIDALKHAEKPIWLFTKYELNDVPTCIKERCAYIKCGRYDETKLSDTYEMYGIKLASTNQIIYKKGKDY